MRAMFTAYREDNEDVEFKFIHVFARIETCEKWTEVRTALAKAARDATPAIEKLHSSILACIADAATHAAMRAE